MQEEMLMQLWPVSPWSPSVEAFLCVELPEHSVISHCPPVLPNSELLSMPSSQLVVKSVIGTFSCMMPHCTTAMPFFGFSSTMLPVFPSCFTSTDWPTLSAFPAAPGQQRRGDTVLWLFTCQMSTRPPDTGLGRGSFIGSQPLTKDNVPAPGRTAKQQETELDAFLPQAELQSRKRLSLML